MDWINAVQDVDQWQVFANAETTFAFNRRRDGEIS
jgi:hypothetical protein